MIAWPWHKTQALKVRRIPFETACNTIVRLRDEARRDAMREKDHEDGLLILGALGALNTVIELLSRTIAP